MDSKIKVERKLKCKKVWSNKCDKVEKHKQVIKIRKKKCMIQLVRITLNGSEELNKTALYSPVYIDIQHCIETQTKTRIRTQHIY